MGKAKIRKKIKGMLKQRIKHIDKFAEAKERDDTGAMNYMGREITVQSKIIDKLKSRLLPKKRGK